MKIKIFSLFIGFILALSLASAALTNNYSCGGSGMMYGAFGGYGVSVMFFSWIIYILVVVLIIAAIYWLVKSANKKK